MTRPDFDRPELDRGHPLADFYAALQLAVAESNSFALPGAYASFRPPTDRMLYREDMPFCCTFSGEKREGLREVIPAGAIRVLYHELVAAEGGVPAGLLLTEEGSRRTTAVQLLPPFGGMELPPPPGAGAVVSIRLTEADLLAVDTDSAALGRRLADSRAQKEWVRSPKLDNWMDMALAAAQREYRRRQQALRGYRAFRERDN